MPLRIDWKTFGSLLGDMKEGSWVMSKSGARLRYVASPTFVLGVSSPMPGCTMVGGCVWGDQLVVRLGASKAGRRVGDDSFATARSVVVCLIQKDIWVNWIVES